MASVNSALPSKYFCCVCDEYFQTVPNLHKHQTYMHSTEELSKVVLFLKGLELPTEYKTSDKLIAELYPLTYNLKKCKGFGLNHHRKGIESNSEITATSSERPKHYNHVKAIGTENESFNSAGKNKNKCNGLKPGLLLESLEGQEWTVYCENMTNETTEFDFDFDEDPYSIDFDEDPYSIDFDDCFGKDNNCSWHMSGDEKECVMGIMKLQSPNLKTSVSLVKGERVTNGTKDLVVSKPSSPIKSTNEDRVAKHGSQGAGRKLLDAAVSDLSSPSENSKTLESLVSSKVSTIIVEKLKNHKTEKKLKRHSKRKVSRPLMQLLPRNTLQESPAVKTSVKSKTNVKSKTSVKSKMNDKMAIIPINITSESSFPNCDNTKKKDSLAKPLKFNNSLSSSLAVSQENVTDKCMTKSIKEYHLRQKSSLFRRKKVTETKDTHKGTTRMRGEKSILKTSLSGVTNNMLSKKGLMNSSEPGFLMNINPEKRFFCELCKKGYTKKSHLERHLRMHTGERPFSCSHCDKQFTVRSVLEQHVRIHTGEKPYSCKICQQRFPQKSGLMTHMMLHTGKPFKCSLCHKAFVSKYKLKKHLEFHHSKTTCKVCKMLFPAEVDLWEHSRVHRKAK